MSTKKKPPRPEAPPKNVFDNREQLHERGEKLGNLVRLTELPDPTEGHPEPPKELYSKAEALLAQNKSSVRKFLSQFTDKRPNDSTEKAAELFTAAATKWKIGQEFQKAAVSFEMANKCFKETENPFGQVQNLSQAAQCWRQAPDLVQAIRVCDECAELYIDLNKHCRAAKELNQMADAYRRLYVQKKQAEHADEAIVLYKRARELFLRDGKSRAACSRVNIECACLLAVPGHKIAEAGEIFENEALFSCNEKLLKYGAKSHFFRAGLCKLNESGVIAHDSFNQYCDAYPSFFETREAILLAELISSVKNKAFGEWTKAIERHETCTRLDPWSKEVIGLIQTKNFTQEDELNFDLEEFLDFNKVPGLDDVPNSSSDKEPDLT